MLQKHFHLQEWAIDGWAFWEFEENIKIVNEITEDEEKQRRKDEESQSKGMGNFDANSMMRNAQSLTGNIPRV